MENNCNKKFDTIYEAFECFKQRFLIEGKSIFYFNSSEIILNQDNLNVIINGFVNNPSDANLSFNEKIEEQIGKNKSVRDLFAHIIWLWGVFASDMRQDSKVDDVSKWLEKDSYTKESKFSFNHGIGSTGQYHKTNKPLELVYIINFFDKILKIENKKEIDFIEIIKGGVKENIEANQACFADDYKNAKKVSMYNILLHLFKPDYYLRAASYGHKEKLVNFFEPLFKLKEEEEYKKIDSNIKEIEKIDAKIKVIKNKCILRFTDKNTDKNKYPYNWNDKYKNFDWNKDFDFYHPEILNVWLNELDYESKNMILHGAPGTGKTYVTEETIKARRNVLEKIEYQLVQFHPNYGYEDFIDGIKPVGLTEQGQMKFELKNGIFKQMCIDAFRNLIAVQKGESELKTYYFIADEINRAELSRVFGELLLCLEDDKRLSFDKEGKLLGTKIKTQNSNLWEEKHAVVVDDIGEMFFGVPENIYFIGTMNDLDRSVDSFDMALRRRFVWKNYRCDYDVIEEKYKDNKNIDSYIEICKKLNNQILEVFNLSSSYELGQAYFMKPKNLTQKELNRVWIEHIAPILKEYLRAEYSEKEIESKLEEAKKIYKF